MSTVFSHRWQLSRRHFLRGAGASLALPFLDAMAPAVAQEMRPPRRSVFVYIPNGVNGMSWQIKKPGRDYEMSTALRPLEKLRDEITVMSGLFHPNGLGQAHVCADTWLTGAKIDAQSARQYHNTISVDQMMAEVTSKYTRFTSLELSVNAGTGQPANSNTLAFSRDGVPLPAEDSPNVVFGRLFGEDPGGKAAQRSRLECRRSVLDAVMDDAQRLRPKLGVNDCGTLDEYLHSVREVEQRARRLEAWLDVPKPKVDGAPFARNVTKNQAGEYYRTMYDLIVLALRTDTTRVATYMSGTEGNGLAIPEIGVTQSRHQLSHHGGDPEVLDRLTKCDVFLMQQFAYFLEKLKTTVDRTMVLLGSGMSYGHSHSNSNLPILLAGGRGLGFRHGQHLDFNGAPRGGYQLTYDEWRGLCGRPKNEKARLSNLMLTMLQKMEVETDRFVDSLGPVSEILG